MDLRRARRTIAATVVVLLGVAAGFASAQQSGTVTDTRQQVLLPRAERDLILAEMRGMLESMRGILYGLASSDMPTIEKAAQAAVMPTPANPELDRRLPEGFLRFRVQTHQSFQALATQARSGGSQDEIIRRLATITNNCVGCHGAYRVVEGAAPAGRGTGATAP